MNDISSHGCSFLGRFYLEIEKQGLSGAELGNPGNLLDKSILP